jgi:putative membrane protein
MTIDKFLSLKERGAITSAVREAERHTSGEIVPMVVSRSHDYPAAAIGAALTLAIPIALLASGYLGAHLWIGHDNEGLFIATAALLFLVFHSLLKKSNGFTALFLNPETVQEEVEKGALAAFYREGLYKTREENGILIYISVFERKVWILADRGINAKIDPQEWGEIVAELSSDIKKGNQGEAICTAVRQIGAILRYHFPYQKNDKDELHNLILKDESQPR